MAAIPRRNISTRMGESYDLLTAYLETLNEKQRELRQASRKMKAAMESHDFVKVSQAHDEVHRHCIAIEGVAANIDGEVLTINVMRQLLPASPTKKKSLARTKK